MRVQVGDTLRNEVVWEWYLVIWYKCLMDRKDTQIVRKDKESLKLLRKSSLRLCIAVISESLRTHEVLTRQASPQTQSPHRCP